jgi:DNA-directed RNA polymerase specialized sigma24 family protein
MSSRVSTTNPPNGPSLPPFHPSQLRPEFRSQPFWLNHTPRFKAFAAHLLSKQVFRGVRGLPPGADEAHDYVNYAVLLILEGRRRCPEHVSSVSFVLGVISSLVSHDSETPEARAPHFFIGTIDDDDEGDGRNVVGDVRVASGEEEIIARDLAGNFMNHLPDLLRRYVQLLVSGGARTAEDRANELGVSVAEIRNLNRRLRRLRALWKGAPLAAAG